MKSDNKLLLPVWIMVAFLAFVVLYLWKSIFIILVFTTLLLILFSWIFRYFHKITWYNSVSAIITWSVFLGFFFLIWFIVSSQIDSFIENFDKFWEGFSKLLWNLWFIWQSISGFDYQKIFENIDLKSIGSNALGTISSIAWWLSTVWLLLIFILLEKDMFLKKLDILTSKKTEKKVHSIYGQIYDDLNVFILSKFFVASLNGAVSFIIMIMFWVEYALLFALFVFLLDFIPAIWGIIALSLPFLYSFVQFDTVWLSFALLACLLIPQFITWNIIEPRLMGKRLNLSWFVILISLIFWSSIWGIAGAFLAVPLMASLNIIFARFELTKPVAVILSQDGNV